MSLVANAIGKQRAVSSSDFDSPRALRLSFPLRNHICKSVTAREVTALTQQHTDEQQQQDPVTAEDEQLADQIEQTEEAPAGAEETTTEATPLTEARLLELLEKQKQEIVGSNANYVAGQMKAMEGRLDSSLAPVQTLLSRAEEQAVAQLEPDEREKYWKDKALKKAAESEPKPEPRDQQRAILSETNQQAAVLAARSFIEGTGADNSVVSNEALWRGWETATTIAEAVEVFKRNYRATQNSSTTETPKPTETPAAKKTAAAPSTTRAPRKSASPFATENDVYEAFGDPDDDRVTNTDQLKAEINKLS